jgi:hypothetical protein
MTTFCSPAHIIVLEVLAQESARIESTVTSFPCHLGVSTVFLFT